MSFFTELRRRNVFRVAGTYAVVAWLLIQVASAVSTPLGFPGWFEAFIIVVLAIGFPVALVLAWAFDITPDGLQLTQSATADIRSGTKRLDYVLIGALTLLAVVTVWDRLPSRPTDDPPSASRPMLNPSIAVLPFKDMSPDGDQEYFGDGIAEELLNVLSRLDGLQVASRTSSFAYKNSNDDVPKIGQALKVSTVLEGSVRKSGKRIRITAQLIDAADGYHLWSDVFDRELTDIFAIQEEISKAVAGALGVRLGVGDVNAFLGAGTSNVDAYESYLKGWSSWNDQDESVRYFETATRIDPNYAAAWSGLGLRIAGSQWASRPEDAQAILDQAYGYVLQAVQLDPASAQSTSLLGTIQYAMFDWIGGAAAHAKALNLHASHSAHEQYGNLLMRAGRVSAADVQFKAAVAAEPLAGTAGLAWQASIGRGQLDEARRQLADVYPDGAPVPYLLAIVLNEGNREEIKTLLAKMPSPSVPARALYAPILRDFDSPEAVVGNLRAVLADDNTWWSSKYHDIALLAAYFGDAELALQSIEKDARYMSIRLQALWYPLMSNVRRLPAFKDLVRDINLVDYWRASGWADDCRPLTGTDFLCE